MDISTVNDAVNQAFTSSNPGGVGTSYGQANSNLIGQAQSEHPELASALASGTAAFNTDGEGVPYLYNTQTGQEITGNYQVTTTPSGGVAINLPLASGAMLQVATGLNQNGTVAPVSASNVYNVGLNSSEGGFAGGLSNFTPALKAAALLYGGSQLAGALGGAEGASALDAGMGAYPTTGNVGTLSALDAGMGVYPSTGTIGAGTAGALGAGTALSNLGGGASALDAGMGVYPSTGTIGALGTGLGAGTALATGLGTGGATGVGTGLGTGAAVGAGTGAAVNGLGLTPLQTGLLGTTALNTLGALGTNTAISNAAGTQAQAGKNVQDVLGGFYNQYAQAQQPYQNLGSGAVAEIQKEAPYLTHQFNAADLQAGLAPNYDFMLQQGQRANQNLANVGGGLLSGNTLQGLQNYTQNYAGNAYQTAFDNYQKQRQNIYGNLSNAAGMGQTSLGQLGGTGASLGQTYGNVTTGLAASQAGAQTAQAVNNANLLSNLGNAALVSSIAGTPGTNLNMKLA